MKHEIQFYEKLTLTKSRLIGNVTLVELILYLGKVDFLKFSRRFCAHLSADLLARVVIVSCLSINLWGCKNKEKRAAEKIGPVLSVSSRSIDLGEVGSYAPVQLDIDLANSGDETAIVDRIDADCKCTVPELASKSLNPGASIRMPVHITTRDQEGIQNRRLSIFWNSKNQSPLTVDIAYRIRNDIEVSTPILAIEVGGGGERKEQEIRLKSMDGVPFQVLDVSFPDYLKCSVGEFEKESSSRIVKTDLVSRLELGLHEGTIVLRTTARINEKIEIVTKVNVRCSLTSDMAAVYLGEIEKDAPVSFTVLVSRFDLKPFKIHRASMGLKDVRLSYPEGESSAISLKATLNPTESGPFADFLEVDGDSDKFENLRISVNATVK